MSKPESYVEQVVVVVAVNDNVKWVCVWENASE